MESNSSNTLFFFFVFLLCLGHCSSQNANATATASNPLIEKVCANSPHSDLCVASLNTDPNSASANVEGLVEIALKVAHANATNTSNHITQLLANSSNMDPFINDCLTDCSEQYIDATDQIDDALVSLTDRAFHDANTWLKAAMADVETCEKGFQEKPGYESPLTQRNTIFLQLCNNALAVIEEFQSGA